MATWDLHRLAEPPGNLALRQNAGSFVGFRALPSASGAAVYPFETLPYVAVRRTGRTPTTYGGSAEVWSDYPRSRLALLMGVDIACVLHADVLQIAVGLPARKTQAFDPLRDALSRCTTERQISVVVAAGNFGPRPGTLSELALVDGVVSVGASWSEAPLHRSSRGSRGGPHPTLCSFPDSGLVGGAYAFVPGTSAATGHVAQIVAALKPVLTWLRDALAAAEQRKEPPGLPDRAVLAHLDTGVGREHPGLAVPATVAAVLSDLPAKLHWLRAVSDGWHEAGFSCSVATDPAALERLVCRLARRPAAYDAAAHGAGYLDENVVRQTLLHLTPTTFLRLFRDEQAAAEPTLQVWEELDVRLGPLWTDQDYLTLWQAYAVARLRSVVVLES